MSEELKPCPFCGCEMTMSDSVNYPSPTGEHYYNCPIEGEDIVATEDNWNRRATLSPAHIEDGEEVEVVGHLLLCAPFSSEEMGDTDVEWDAKVAERLQREMATSDDVSLPLMTVAQHQRIVAALFAPPAAGVPEKADAWKVTGYGEVTVTPQYPAWGEADPRLAIQALYAAPTPPASEQQMAVVMPERLPVRMPQGRNLPQGYAQAWNDCMDEWLRLNPHLAKGEGVRP